MRKIADRDIETAIINMLSRFKKIEENMGMMKAHKEDICKRPK